MVFFETTTFDWVCLDMNHHIQTCLDFLLVALVLLACDQIP